MSPAQLDPSKYNTADFSAGTLVTSAPLLFTMLKLFPA